MGPRDEEVKNGDALTTDRLVPYRRAELVFRLEPADPTNGFVLAVFDALNVEGADRLARRFVVLAARLSALAIRRRLRAEGNPHLDRFNPYTEHQIRELAGVPARLASLPPVLEAIGAHLHLLDGTDAEEGARALYADAASLVEGEPPLRRAA